MNDVASERGVLAGVFQHGTDAFLDCDDLVTSNTFTVDSNQFIFTVVKKVFESADAHLDLATFYATANSLGLTAFFEGKEEKDHLRAVMSYPVDQRNVRKLAAKIRKLEIGRLLKSQLGKAQSKISDITGDESIDHIIGLAENPIFDFSSLLTEGGGPQPISKGLREYLDNAIDNPRELVGISSGFPIYDRMIGGGLRPGVSMISARIKVGKSFFAANVALFVAMKLQLPTLYVDTEMVETKHFPRILGCISGVPSFDIERGKLDDDAKKAVYAARDLIEARPYQYMSIVGVPFEETLSVIRRWLLRKVGKDESGKIKNCLIVWDWFKLSGSSVIGREMKQYEALTFQMASMHNFAAKYGVPMLTFGQLNREQEISGSDGILQAVSNFSFLKELSDDERGELHGHKEQYNRKLIPTITRDGIGVDDGDFIYLKFDGSIGRMTEGVTRNSLHASRNSAF